MGMYTGLRVKATVKPEYRAEISNILNDNDWDGRWRNSSLDFCKEFGKIGRSCFFPTAELCYMPESWGDKYKGTEEIPNTYDEETGYWTFSMSIKNYEMEIDYFLENVLGRLTESVEFCEYLYEEDDESTFWVKDDDTMRPVGYGIVYRDGYEDSEEDY